MARTKPADRLYSYVESKEALFYLAIDQGRSLASSAPLPFRDPEPGTFAKRVAERFRQDATMPALSAALARPRADDAAGELETIAGELYASLARSAPLITILDRSAADMPELAELFFNRIPGGLITRLLRARADSGQYRRTPHPAANRAAHRRDDYVVRAQPSLRSGPADHQRRRREGNHPRLHRPRRPRCTERSGSAGLGGFKRE
jgi:hypothetical protein